MKISTLVCAASLVAVTALSGVVLAHDSKSVRHEMQQPRGQQDSIKRMLSGLELTDSQREQIKVLVQQHRKTARQNQQDGAGHKALRAQLLEKQYDEVVVRDLLQQQQQENIEKRLAMFKLRHQIVQLLTDEQLDMLKQKKQRRHNNV